MTRIRYTSRDLKTLKLKEGQRAEIIDGELYLSSQPHNYHQLVCNNTGHILATWSDDGDLGFVLQAPGVIFAEDDDVAPDLVWVSRERAPLVWLQDGKFHAAPELVVEVLSAGRANERRDLEIKLALYRRRDVPEYWIVNWRLKQLMVYRWEQGELRLAGTLGESDTITSPVLPGFSCPVSSLFRGVGMI